MKSKTIIITLVSIALFAITSCKKEGMGGKSTVKGYVKHHSVFIPNATVYIKYGATEFPGADISVYNTSVQADASGYYEIKNLQKGHYYLYGVGVDAGISENVYGGISVSLRRKEVIEKDVFVVE
jgi:hypothetical protein